MPHIVLIVFEFGLVVELIVELIVSRYFAVMLIVKINSIINRVQMAYQAWSHQPMVVEPEEATKHPSGVDKVTSDGHRH